MINPTIKQFQAISKEFKMAAISLEMEGDMDTPITLFKKLCNQPNSYLLESVEGGNKWGRYSYIGRNPFMIIKSYGGKVHITKGDKSSYQTGNPLKIVKTLMAQYATAPLDHLPDFIGGAVGSIGYDFIRNNDHLSDTYLDDLNMPDIHLLLSKEVIAYDHVKQEIKIIINVPLSGDLGILYTEAVQRLHAIKKEILENKCPLEVNKTNGSKQVKYTSNESKEAFMKKVLKAKEHIANEEVQQVVLSQRLQVENKVSPFQAYRTLRGINPSPYMFYMDFGDYHLVGSSPELLTKVKGNTVVTCPIAGTRPRGKNAQEDDAYAKELLKDKKELAEHLMLVDLSKADIKKVAKDGTIQVDPLMEVQKYSHVMHLVSLVTGEKKDECDMYDSLMACFPAGTVSGSPKTRAMEIIDSLENKKRGPYAGAVGYLGFNGNMDTCITIRTIVFKDGMAYIQAGAGIVADSDPETEYKETLKKAKALMVTIEKAGGGLC